MTKKKSWQEKMKKPEHPEIKQAPENWAKKYNGHKMLIPTPKIIEEMIRKIPQGKLITLNSLRNLLAKEHQADFTCPLTTGIFLRIVAEAAEEAKREGAPAITPYWRVVKDDGTLNPKFPQSPELQSTYLKNEKFEIVPKGRKNLMVKNFNAYLINSIS